MKIYGPENAHLIPKVQALLKNHIVEDTRAGIYSAYSELISLMVLSSMNSSDETRISKFAPAGGVEQPLLARIGRYHEPGAFRLTLSRVEPDTLDTVPDSTLTVATFRPVRQFKDIAETFTLPQIELVSKHALQIVAIDGLIATYGLKGEPEES